MVFQHPVTLRLDFDSLEGRFERIQPFIHQGLTAAVEALTHLAFEPKFKPKVAEIQEVVVAGLDGSAGPDVAFDAGVLTVGVPIKLGDHRAPTKEVKASLAWWAGM
jgi:hypothetical protein